MDFNELRAKAKDALKGFCRVCPVCNGKACAGEVPGMGGAGTGDGFKANFESLASIKLNLRTLHAVKEVDTSIELFGQTLSMPVLSAPMTGVVYNMGGQMTEQAFAEAIMAGSAAAGTIGMIGDGAIADIYDSGLAAMSKHPGFGAAIIKPRAQAEIIARLRRAEEAKAVAVGCDVDGAGLVTMALKGQPVGPKTIEELQELTSATKLPFIVKGIMTPDEAVACVEAGAKAIVVSNHGGRILDHTPGVADVLPEIAEAVAGQIIVLADGAVRTGADVLKLVALGADAVLLGRPLAVGAFGNGAEGVAMVLNKLKAELAAAMLVTGTPSMREVSPDILW